MVGCSCKIKVKSIKDVSRNKGENSFFCGALNWPKSPPPKSWWPLSKSASHTLCKFTANQARDRGSHQYHEKSLSNRPERFRRQSRATPVSLNPQLKFADRPVPPSPSPSPFLRFAVLLHHAPATERQITKSITEPELQEREFLMIEPPRVELAATPD